IEPIHEQPEHHDAEGVHLLDEGREGLGPIDVLVHAGERRARYRFKANAQQRAAALGGEFEHAVVLCKLGGDPSLPMNMASVSRAHNFFWPLRRTKKIGVVDRDGPRAAVFHLMNHLVDWPITESESVHQRLGAESAALMAAARGLDKGAVDVAVLLQKVVTWHRESDHRVQCPGLVRSSHLPLSDVIEQSIHHKLDFTDDNGIAVLQRFLRHKAWMHTTHDNGDAFGAELVGDLIAAIDVARHGGNTDKVRFQIKIDCLDIFVRKYNFVLVAWNAGCHRK